jgi:hypothetical protein
LYPANVAVLKG